MSHRYSYGRGERVRNTALSEPEIKRIRKFFLRNGKFIVGPIVVRVKLLCMLEQLGNHSCQNGNSKELFCSTRLGDLY